MWMSSLIFIFASYVSWHTINRPYRSKKIIFIDCSSSSTSFWTNPSSSSTESDNFLPKNISDLPFDRYGSIPITSIDSIGKEERIRRGIVFDSTVGDKDSSFAWFCWRPCSLWGHCHCDSFGSRGRVISSPKLWWKKSLPFSFSFYVSPCTLCIRGRL